MIGLLVLDHGDTSYDYPQEELALAQTVARLAALVIERKRQQNERAAAQASELAQRAANRRMEEFLSVASHELKSPLIDISRIQANKLELHMRINPCDLTAIVQEVIQNQRQINPTRSIHLSMRGTQQQLGTNLPTSIG